jgi:ribosome recycling factor
MDYDEILLDAEERMEKAVDHLRDVLRGIRTGRASPGLVDGLRVEYYGSPTPLKQIANIAIPEPRMIMIKPFDPGSVKDIEKAIQKSDLGISPSSDGKILRLQIPPLSEDRRKQLASLVKERAEEARVSMRNVRRDANKSADAAEKDSTLTEDEARKLRDEIQELIKTYEEKVDAELKKKTEEILTI